MLLASEILGKSEALADRGLLYVTQTKLLRQLWWAPKFLGAGSQEIDRAWGTVLAR